MKREIITLTFSIHQSNNSNPFIELREDVEREEAEKKRALEINKAVQAKHVQILDGILNDFSRKIRESGLDISLLSRNDYSYCTLFKDYANKSLMATIVFTNKGVFDIGIQSKEIEGDKYPIFSEDYEFLIRVIGRAKTTICRDYESFESNFVKAIHHLIVPSKNKKN